MKRITLNSIVLLCTVFLFRSSIQAQNCPMGVWNTGDKIGLINPDFYSSFVPNTYYVTFISSNPINPAEPCFITDMAVSVTKVPDLNSIIPGADALPGVVINFPPSPCTGGTALPTNTENDALQYGATSIVLRATPLGEPVFLLNMTDSIIDDCSFIVIPVTFGAVNVNMVSSPNRAKVEWTTYSESNVDHFSIEKSQNAVNWHKIGQVTAAGNSSTTLNYTFYDNSPNNIAYYRIVSIDIDCSRQYSLTRRLDCSYCSTTFTWPSVPADCNPPSPYLAGPAAICNNAKTIYRLNNLEGNAQVTWSLSPSYFANLSQASRLAGLTPTGIPGNATLTATVVKNGVTTYYHRPIVFGVQLLYVFGVTDDPGSWYPTVEHTATVANVLPGTEAWEYTWYKDGGWIGTGTTHSWTLWREQVITYEVRYNGPCGQSIAYGSSNAPFKPAPCQTYTVSPNPARTMISIAKTRCPGDTRKSAIENTMIVVKVYDMQGILRKATKASAVSSKIDINAAGLLPGLYYIQISEPGKEEVKLKVLIEQ